MTQRPRRLRLRSSRRVSSELSLAPEGHQISHIESAVTVQQPV